jgi:hypothetical protein
VPPSVLEQIKEMLKSNNILIEQDLCCPLGARNSSSAATTSLSAQIKSIKPDALQELSPIDTRPR